MIELLQFKNAFLELMNTDIEHLSDRLMDAVMTCNTEIYDKYIELVSGDLETDYMQMIFQYYMADRVEKKQDFTPPSVARFMSKLIGSADVVVDLCAGSGALTIKRWIADRNAHFELYEIDSNVIPFLLFNLAVRNISAAVNVGDAIRGEISRKLRVIKGKYYAKVIDIKSTL